MNDVLLMPLKLSELERLIENSVSKAINSNQFKEPHKEKGIYLTKQEAAKLLKVSPGSIDNYRRRGQIQSYQIGRNVLFKEEELLEVVEQ